MGVDHVVADLYSMHSASRVISRSSMCSGLVSVGMVSSFMVRRLPDDLRLAQRACLQVTVHEVDLLQAAKALADVLRPDLPHAVDRLQLGVGGGKDLVQPAELAHDAWTTSFGSRGCGPRMR